MNDRRIFIEIPFDFFKRLNEPETTTPKPIERVFVSCPVENLEYAQECMADSLAWGEAPIVPQLLYKQVITHDDEAVLTVGNAWLKRVDKVVIYKDKGINEEMQGVIEFCAINNINYIYRTTSEMN